MCWQVTTFGVVLYNIEKCYFNSITNASGYNISPLTGSSYIQLHIYFFYLFPGEGGGLLWPKLYVDVPAILWKSDFLYTNFFPYFSLISIPFSKETHPILTKLDAFYDNVPKYTHKFI